VRSHLSRLGRLAGVGGVLGLLVALAVAWWAPADVAPAPAQLAPAKLQGPAVAKTVEWAGVVLAPPAAPGHFVADTVLDLCGLARLSVLRADAEPKPDAEDTVPTLDSLPAPVGRDALAVARAGMLAALRAGDARARVAALLLSPPASDNWAERTVWAQSLLQEAVASQDAVNLVSAEPACGHLPDAVACRRGLIRARLRIEPDNARHWAALADEDPDAHEEAWAGLLRAKHWHEGAPTLLLASQAAVPAHLPGYLRLALGAEVRGRVGDAPTPGEGFVLEQCRADVPERRAQCEHLMQLMVGHSDSPLTLVPAQKLADTLGWPAARQHALQQELRMLLRSTTENSHADQAWSCTAVDEWKRHLVQVASLGELGALRARLRGPQPASP
jgi:hypothetical protein